MAEELITQSARSRAAFPSSNNPRTYAIKYQRSGIYSNKGAQS
jgi:hypothetical protein